MAESPPESQAPVGQIAYIADKTGRRMHTLGTVTRQSFRDNSEILTVRSLVPSDNKSPSGTYGRDAEFYPEKLRAGLSEIEGELKFANPEDKLPAPAEPAVDTLLKLASLIGNATLT